MGGRTIGAGKDERIASVRNLAWRDLNLERSDIDRAFNGEASTPVPGTTRTIFLQMK